MYKKRNQKKDKKGATHDDPVGRVLFKNLGKMGIKTSQIQKTYVCEKMKAGFYFCGTAPAIGGHALMMQKKQEDGFVAVHIYPDGMMKQHTGMP